MSSMPRDPAFDSTLALLNDPYRFIGNRCRRLKSNLFQTRLLLQPTICMTGAEAAELFYDLRRFTRIGAAPEPVRATLFGKGGVQGLDGHSHQHRKAMFLSLLTPQRVEHLADDVAAAWSEATGHWQQQTKVVLYEAVQQLLTQAVCRWAGVSMPPEELPLRTRQLVSLFDEAGSLRHFRSRRARSKAEQWLSGLIDDVRTERLKAPEESALSVIAWHRDGNDSLLPLRVAAVELLNVLRPTVAVSVFVAFAAHAMHAFPFCLGPLQAGNARYLEWFVQEVRRYYPFFPAVAARVRETFEWQGLRFERGRRVILDLYGTDHDPAVWGDPEAFRPERFCDQKVTPFNFIPQGGGDVRADHRCPGEGVAVAVMKVSVGFLVGLRYQVPSQDLRIDLQRLPAIPRSGFVIAGVTL